MLCGIKRATAFVNYAAVVKNIGKLVYRGNITRNTNLNGLRLCCPKQISRYASSSSSNNNESDEEAQNRLKLYKLELRVWYEQGDEVCDPDELTSSDWQHVLTILSEAERKRFFNYRLTEIANKSIAQESEPNQYQQDGSATDQHTSQNNIFNLITEETMNKWKNKRLWKARMFNDPAFIFDCSYDHHMKLDNRLNIASELYKSLEINRRHRLPFNIHLAGVTFNQLDTINHLQEKIPDLLARSNPIQVHTECFSTLYPAKNLIYLSPFSRNVIQAYSPNDTFVIGAIDGDAEELYSEVIAKAKRLNIPTAWFPLQHYLNWSFSAHKQILSLSQVTNVMLGIKSTKKWNRAFVGLPKYELEKQRPSRTNKTQFGKDVRFRINKRIIGSGVPRHKLPINKPCDGYFKEKP